MARRDENVEGMSGERMSAEESVEPGNEGTDDGQELW